MSVSYTHLDVYKRQDASRPTTTISRPFSTVLPSTECANVTMGIIQWYLPNCLICPYAVGVITMVFKRQKQNIVFLNFFLIFICNKNFVHKICSEFRVD